MSRHLSPRQIQGLDKMGDILIPGEDTPEGFLSFSESGCSREIDRVLDYMPDSDRNDLKLLLLLISFLPRIMVRAFLAILELSPKLPDRLGGPLRFVRLAVRGLVLTLYYSHPHAHQVLEYRVGVYMGDQK